uniref:hypothetical protein n=1 Tax=Photorhabdus sp. RM322S TaxID=3342825 RepID=UPI0036D962F0
MTIILKSINKTLKTSFNEWMDIEGLSLDLTQYSLRKSGRALIILNVPSPYATGNNYPNVSFAITMNSEVLAKGSISYSLKKPDSSGRIPITLQTDLDLTKVLGTVQARWSTDRGSTGHIDSYCSISAIIDEGK